MNKKLPILAIETSGDLCSVAVMIDEKTYAETSVNQKHVHSEKLMSLIMSTLESVEVSLMNVGHIAISIGPGSFTGLRIGMAAVKGLGLGSSLPIVPVPAFEALALKICRFVSGNQQFIIANNVNVKEIYYAKYKRVGENYREIENLKLIWKSEFDKIVGNDDLVFGNYFNFNPLTSIAFPYALDIARWSYIFGEDLLTYEYDYLEPNYLKNFDIKANK
ncbi:tRNA (adenosine(37)-N6)-threonylcarbamoyltransferase complex dimerization subunit type 1 TsaB [Bacteroidota bacterium]